MREAGEVLSITKRTIAFHKYRVMREFGLKSRANCLALPA